MSRAAFKLLEIQKKHKVIRPGEQQAQPSRQCRQCALGAAVTWSSIAFASSSLTCFTFAGSKVLDLGCVPGAWLQVRNSVMDRKKAAGRGATSQQLVAHWPSVPELCQLCSILDFMVCMHAGILPAAGPT